MRWFRSCAGAGTREVDPYDTASVVRSPSPSAGPPSPPVQRRGDPPAPRRCTRVLIKLCCSPDSSVGSVAEAEFPDCRVSRITETDDFTSQAGKERVRIWLEDCIRQQCPVLVWVAFPCTGGSAWQTLNWRRGTESTLENIRSHWSNLRAVWQAFVDIVLPQISGRTVYVAFEWPAACAY